MRTSKCPFFISGGKTARRLATRQVVGGMRGTPCGGRQRDLHLVAEFFAGLQSRNALERDAVRSDKLNRRRRRDVENVADAVAFGIVHVDFDADKGAGQTLDVRIDERVAEHLSAIFAVFRHEENERRLILASRRRQRLVVIGEENDAFINIFHA